MNLNAPSQVKRGGKGLRGVMPFKRPSKSNVQEQRKGGQLPGPGAAVGLAAQTCEGVSRDGRTILRLDFGRGCMNMYLSKLTVRFIECKLHPNFPLEETKPCP